MKPSLISLISVFTVTICLHSIFVSGDKLSKDECHELGFNSDELWCDKCNELKKFELEEVKKSCVKCCKKDDTPTKKKFAYARLEYCECNISNFPQIKAFIRGDFPKKYNNLKIKYVRGVTPQLKLLDENHKVLDDLNIQKWDTDTLEEFLNERLQN